MSGDTRRVTGPVGAHRSATDRPVGALRPRRALPPGSVGAALPEGLLENKSWSLWDEGRDLCSFFSGVTSAKGSEIPTPTLAHHGLWHPGKIPRMGQGEGRIGLFSRDSSVSTTQSGSAINKIHGKSLFFTPAPPGRCVPAALGGAGENKVDTKHLPTQ